MENITVRPLTIDDSEAMRLFMDKWSGANYFSPEEAEVVLKLGQKDGVTAAFCAEVDGELAGVRLTFAPGQWIKSQGRGLTPDKWDVPEDTVAYFKSLFVADKFQQLGIGKTLSRTSIKILKEMGARAIICHSWLESPGNSSQRYLQRMGFSAVQEHPRFWYPIDYHCFRCGPDRCVCTAVEMIKYLDADGQGE